MEWCTGKPNSTSWTVAITWSLLCKGVCEEISRLKLLEEWNVLLIWNVRFLGGLPKSLSPAVIAFFFMKFACQQSYWMLVSTSPLLGSYKLHVSSSEISWSGAEWMLMCCTACTHWFQSAVENMGTIRFADEKSSFKLQPQHSLWINGAHYSRVCCGLQRLCG